MPFPWTLSLSIPNPKTTIISVDLSCSGIPTLMEDPDVKLGDSAQARTSLFIKAGQRETKRVDMYLANSESVISFGNPVIEELKVK